MSELEEREEAATGRPQGIRGPQKVRGWAEDGGAGGSQGVRREGDVGLSFEDPKLGRDQGLPW